MLLLEAKLQIRCRQAILKFINKNDIDRSYITYDILLASHV